MKLDPNRVATPCWVVDLSLLERNLEVLADVQRRAGCKILLALKGFAMWSVFPLIRRYLSGVAASSAHEAELGRREFGAEVHAYAPAYSEEELRDILEFSDHVVFNSGRQWERFRALVRATGPSVACGLRVNPEHSEVEVPLYDPCAKGSRLGATRRSLVGCDLDGITGLHFHTLCQKNSDALERTLVVIEDRFRELLEQSTFVNFGGGHHVTRGDYDIERLVRVVGDFKARRDVAVYLEPGEAVALNTGVLVASVLDVVENDGPIAILDTSFTAHMPDVLEMPYRPEIIGAGAPGTTPHTYHLGGSTCLAGDTAGAYSFSRRLEPGDRLVFTDMAHYTMVKTTTFNGVRLPSIATYDSRSDRLEVVRRFGYEDYKSRLS